MSRASENVVAPAASAQNAGAFFRQLSDSDAFRKFARLLRDITGLAMNLNTPDVHVSIGGSVKQANPICKLIRGTGEGARRCEACDRRQHALAASEGKSRLYTCHAGFRDLAIPIMLLGEHVATISSGQVLAEKPSRAALARLSRRLAPLGVSKRSLAVAYRRALWMPRARLVSVMRLLELFGTQICEQAWRVRELEARLQKPFICKTRELVEERYRDPQLRLADAAARAGMSRAHFSHAFHKELGLTWTRYVQSRRIEEAKRLLTETDRSVTDICFDCGFNSLTHFNRVFRASEGCSPSRHRAAPASRIPAAGSSAVL